MSSSLTINFSLRQNKAIERAIAFDALTTASAILGEDPIYVGLGSLWFQDFQMAHRLLHIRNMFSIEGDDAVYKRANFNCPLRTIEVVHKKSTLAIPELLAREELIRRPWIAWLDYDRELCDDRLDELRGIVTSVPNGSVLLTTFNANAKNYGVDSAERRLALTELLTEDYVDPGLPDEAFDEPELMATLASSLLDYLQGMAVRGGRNGGFVPAIRLLYRDSAYMATVGGFLPSPNMAESCQIMIAADTWCGFEDSIIETQPLTMRELQALSKLMPVDGSLDPAVVAALGFELDDEQLRFYERHYLRYPIYAEIR